MSKYIFILILGLMFSISQLAVSGMVEQQDDARLPHQARRYVFVEPDNASLFEVMLSKESVCNELKISNVQIAKLATILNDPLTETEKQQFNEIRAASLKTIEKPKDMEQDCFTTKIFELNSRNYLSKMRGVLTEVQVKRFFPLFIQIFGLEKIFMLKEQKEYADMIKQLSLSDDQSSKIDKIIEAFHSEQIPLIKFLGRCSFSEWARGSERLLIEQTNREIVQKSKQLAEMNKACDVAIWDTLNENQRQVIDAYLGNRIEIDWSDELNQLLAPSPSAEQNQPPASESK